ncbi:hypothetical protein PMAYCL1PPCAC_19868, partial [Pristionchus mayeri]
ISNALIYACLTICFAIGVICGLTVLYLHQRNSKRLERIVSWEERDLYIISYKYQLLENLRAFKLLFIIGVCGSIGIVLSVLALLGGFTAYKKRNANVRVLFGALFESVNATTVFVVIVAGQYAISMNRSSIFERLKSMIRCRRRFREMLATKTLIAELSTIDVHFDGLCKKWNDKFDDVTKTRNS